MPKIYKKVFLEKVNYQNMYNAYISARKSKRYRKDIILFNLRYEEMINSICEKIKNQKYIFGKFKEFYVCDPKVRRILAAPFCDRVVHTWFVKEFLEKIFVPQFISTSYACIKDKGMHKCALDIKKAMFNVSRNNNNAYVIKMDVAKFFDSIDRNILFNILKRKVSDINFINFTKKILSSSSEYDRKDGISIPIGNYTSQMFGNIYLNEVDKYAKEQLKCKYYFRYMDDTCIICKNKQETKFIFFKLTCSYAEKIHLVLNNKTDIFPIKNGINFCGYKISNKGYMNLRNKGKKRLVKKLKKNSNYFFY